MRATRTDARDRVPHLALLVALLAALFAGAGIAPAATIYFGHDGPLSLVKPQISGDPRVGGTLTCERGTWNDSDREPYAVSYAWFYDGVEVDVGAGATHVVTADDVSQDLYCEVTARDGWQSSDARSPNHYVDGPSPYTLPTLSGDDHVGGALTCTRGVWNDRGLAAPYPVEYAWQRDGEPIEGAATSSYTVTAADAGHALNCVVTAAGAGFATSGLAFPDGPRNHLPPQVSGDPRAGGTLTCTPGTWDGGYAYTYAWLRDGEAIALATAASYLAGPQDAGHDLVCRVTAAGLTEAASAPLAVRTPQTRTAPLITGDLRLGGTLTCDPGRWDGDYAFTYAWTGGDTAPTHVVSAADIGQSLTCTVAADGLSPATSGAVVPTSPIVRNAPTPDGDARLGRTLTCDTGSWDGTYALTTEWTRDGDVIGTGATHKLEVADVGHALRCRVTAAGLTVAESRTAFIPAPRNLVAPSITGDPATGQTLTCNRGTWDEPAGAPYPVRFAWLSGGQEVGTTDALTAGADGTTYTCVVSVEGLAAADSPAVTVSAPATGTPQNRTAPVVSGTPKLGATLACNPGRWNGTYTFTYAWQRDGVALADGTTRVIAPEDIGHQLTCTETTGGVTAPSGIVIPSAPVATSPPEIKGTPRLGRTLTCTPGTWDGDYTPVLSWTARVVGAGDIGVALGCTATVAGVSAASATVTPTAPVNRAAPALTGDPRVGGTLTCGPGQWDDDYPLTQRWLNGATELATGATYVPAPADAGATLHCEATAGGVAASSRAVTVRAPSARTAPVLSGTPRLKGTITCAPGDWDGSYTFTYRWLRDGDVVGTSASYAPVAADLDAELLCEVTAAGLTPAESAPVAVSAPRSLTEPTVSGDPVIDATLTCAPGTWDAGDYALTYRWLRETDEIAIGTTYTVTAADLNGRLACEVKAEGVTTATTGWVAAHGPEALTPPVLSGTPNLRGTLRCTSGTWDGGYALAHRWYRDGKAIAGETGTAYAVQRGDLETEIGCSVTAAGLTESHSESLQIDPPHAIEGPRIEGALHPRRAVTCNPGRWNDRDGARYQLSYQWFYEVEGLEPVPGGDGQTYVLTAADVERRLTCVVTAEREWTERAGTVRIRWEPLGVYLSADDDSVAPGAANSYTLTVRNPNPVPATETQLHLRLPAGFTYTASSTTGVTSAEPVITGDELRWNGEFPIPADGEIKLHLKVATATEPEHYTADAWAVSDDFEFRENGDYESARITVEGPAPACTITGTAGNDLLAGTPGDDVICGLGGDDRLNGSDGNDTLHGGDGNDLLDGGAGADVMRGGGGLDTVTYANRTAPLFVTIGNPLPDGQPGIDADDDGTFETPPELDAVDADVEIVRGGKGDDRLIGSSGDEELYGGAGRDEIRGNSGDDLLDGGPGDDFVRSNDGRYGQIQCGAGVDTFERDAFDRVAACELEFFEDIAT